jgi:4-hydroxybenzoate polyprenyltransferase
VAKSRFDFIRHHPLCPNCGYDLVATIDAGRNVCPECGCEFEGHELKRAVLPEDWTIARGLGWGLALWGIATAAAWLAAGRNWRIAMVTYLVAMLLLLASGAVIGRVLAKNMDEIAGLTSLLVSGLITAFAWGAIVGGTLIVLALTPLGGPPIVGAALIACGCSLAIIVKTHHFEDY